MFETARSRRNSIELVGAKAGTAMPAEMRQALNLRGLVPASIEDFTKQEMRAFQQLMSKPNSLEKYEFLAGLRCINVNLFFRLVLNHFKEVAPLIYTPTVGEACLNYSHIYPFIYPCKTSVGLFITLKDVENIDLVIENYRSTMSEHVDPEIAVITDGSRILGLGDLGINGMAIPIGKLQLYVAIGGLNPSRTLPIVLDFGTNNKKYLNDPLYLGTRQTRPDDETFYDAAGQVLSALYRAFPDILIQFEDFSTDHAFGLLKQWRKRALCFNDDIQGTGCVILGGFISAVEQAGIPAKDQRILFVGAGSAAVGVARQLLDYFIIEHKIPEEEAKAMFWFVDSRGMITANRGDKLAQHKTYFARHDNGDTQCQDLEATLEYVKPTALIGLSTIHKAFNEHVLTRMSEINSDARPIIFPLSNPETKAECSFEEAMRFTNNRVLFASGTAFPAYTIPESGEVRIPGQGNNMYVFPAIGLGASLCKPEWITDTMIYAVSKALANSLNEQEKARGELYPRIERIRDVAARLTAAFITQAVREGQVRDKHWEEIVATNMPDMINKKAVTGLFTKRVLGEVKTLMWAPASSVEQYIVEAMTYENPDDI
ncbi:malic enzyme [Coemansia mojavensis]|nr:malic enzyme [Coemansia mojavensis]